MPRVASKHCPFQQNWKVLEGESEQTETDQIDLVPM